MQRLTGAVKSIAVTASRRRTVTASFSTSLLFDETQIRFKEGLQQFVQEKIAPHADKIDKMDSFPEDVNLWKAMGDFDLHGLTAPVEYGGLDVGYLYHCMAMEEISRASASVGLSYGVHSNVCLNQLVRHGNAAQKEKYLPKLISGDHVGALSISEPNGFQVCFGSTQLDKEDDLKYPTGNFEKQQLITDESLLIANKIDKVESSKGFVKSSSTKSTIFPSETEESEKLSMMKVAALIETIAKQDGKVLDLQSKLMENIEWLPVSLGKLSNITELNLSDNKIMALPTSITNLTALTKLDVHSNQLINLPNLFGGLVNLLNLDLHANRLRSLPESFVGSDAVGIKCKADRVDGGYVINGNKMWCTNGGIADTLVVYAKTDISAGSKGITAFIVEKGTPGFIAAQKLDKLGMRGSGTYELVFENCFVPTENILGEVGKGVYIMMPGLDLERIVFAAAPIGIMQACLDVVLPYVRQREQFGRPIGEFQLMEGKLADMYVSLQSSRSYVYSVARDCDNGNVVTKDCAGAILVAAERATQVALQAIQCLGGNGYVNEYPTGRFLRDTKLYEIGAGTNEIRRMLIGRQLFREQ